MEYLRERERERWLPWVLLRRAEKQTKFTAVQIFLCSPTAQQFDSKLYLNDQSIPFIWNHTIKFLGGPIQVLMTNQDHKQHLKEKLAQLLNKVDQVPVTRKQKLLLYKAGICPCLNWDLSILELPISWIHSTLDATTTCFLKKWSSLADPACLYLPKGDEGLALPPISLLST